MPPQQTKSSRIENLRNRIAGTADLIDKAFINLQETNAHIRARTKLRQKLLDSICGDPDRKDFANKDGKVFKLEIAGLKARVVELEESTATWKSEVQLLQLRLAYTERTPF